MAERLEQRFDSTSRRRTVLRNSLALTYIIAGGVAMEQLIMVRKMNLMSAALTVMLGAELVRAGLSRRN